MSKGLAMDAVTARSLAMKDALDDAVGQRFCAEPEHMWESYPEYEVFRHHGTSQAKGRWFLLVADVTYGQVGVEAPDPDARIYVAVVKADPAQVEDLVGRPGFARAYHMNRHHWVSVLLDGSVPLDEVEGLVKASFDLTA